MSSGSSRAAAARRAAPRTPARTSINLRAAVRELQDAVVKLAEEIDRDRE
jgi:hypothetical protein